MESSPFFLYISSIRLTAGAKRSEEIHSKDPPPKRLDLERHRHPGVQQERIAPQLKTVMHRQMSLALNALAAVPSAATTAALVDQIRVRDRLFVRIARVNMKSSRSSSSSSCLEAHHHLGECLEIITLVLQEH